VRRLRTLEVNCFVGERVTVGIEEHVNKKEEVKSNIGLGDLLCSVFSEIVFVI
jgi:hypothetical protein